MQKPKRYQLLRTRISESAYFVLRDASEGRSDRRRASVARRLIRLGIQTWTPPELVIDGTTYRVTIAEGAMYRYVSFNLLPEYLEWIRKMAAKGYTQNWLVSKLIEEGYKASQMLEREQKEARKEAFGAGG